MKLKYFYLVMAAVGFVVPYYFFVSFLQEYGLDLRELWRQLFANSISAFFALDLLIASVVFIFYLRTEAARYSMKRWWIFLLPLFTVGLSLAFPLFLYWREGYSEK
jgi:hypothetical protein